MGGGGGGAGAGAGGAGAGAGAGAGFPNSGRMNSNPCHTPLLHYTTVLVNLTSETLLALHSRSHFKPNLLSHSKLAWTRRTRSGGEGKVG